MLAFFFFFFFVQGTAQQHGIVMSWKNLGPFLDWVVGSLENRVTRLSVCVSAKTFPETQAFLIYIECSRSRKKQTPGARNRKNLVGTSCWKCAVPGPGLFSVTVNGIFLPVNSWTSLVHLSDLEIAAATSIYRMAISIDFFKLVAIPVFTFCWWDYICHW